MDSPGVLGEYAFEDLAGEPVEVEGSGASSVRGGQSFVGQAAAVLDCDVKGEGAGARRSQVVGENSFVHHPLTCELPMCFS